MAMTWVTTFSGMEQTMSKQLPADPTAAMALLWDDPEEKKRSAMALTIMNEKEGPCSFPKCKRIAGHFGAHKV